MLCGSDKFPVKEPFVNLLKSSMQTFLNAMTFPDKTMYPVASTNGQDLLNLMDVYLDAVLHPAIYHKRAIFEQEGWHYELAGDMEADEGDAVAGDAVAQTEAADGQTRLALNGVAVSYTHLDVYKRQAIAQAINVEELVQTIYGDYATLANSVMPVWMAPYCKDVKQTAYDPEAAKATLAAKGVTSLQCITYTTARPYNQKGGSELARLIQGYLCLLYTSDDKLAAHFGLLSL